MRIQSLYDLHLLIPDIDGFWDGRDLADTERLIRSNLPLGAGPVTAAQVEALTQAVRLFSLQGNMKVAKEFLVCAESHLKDLTTEERLKPQIRYFLEEGRLHSVAMNPKRALESFRQAWELSAKIKKLDFLLIDAAYMLSTTLPVKEGKEWLRLGLETAVKSEHQLSHKWLPFLHMAAGWQSFDMYEFAKALTYFEMANKVSTNAVTPTVSRIAKWCLGRALRTMSRFDEAIQIQLEIESEMSSHGLSNGYVYLELAECYQALFQTDKAQPYFEMAYEKLKTDKWFMENSESQLLSIQKKSKLKKYQ